MSLRLVAIPKWSSLTGSINGAYKVAAEATGPFLIYKTPEIPGFWTLGHARTRRTINKRLPSRASARALARELAGFQWDFELLDPTAENGCPRRGDFSLFPRGVRRQMRQAAKIAEAWGKKLPTSPSVEGRA